MSRTRLIIASGLLSVLVLTGCYPFTRAIHVPAGKPTIQAAIDTARDGDVVVVAEGTYRENIDFKGKAITVRSTDPTDPAVVAATIIDGGRRGSVVTFKSEEKATSVLSGFTRC